MQQKQNKQYHCSIVDHDTGDTLLVSFAVDSAFHQASFGGDCWTDSDKCFGFIKDEKCYFHLNCWKIQQDERIELTKIYHRDSLNIKDAYIKQVISQPKYDQSHPFESMYLQYWHDSAWNINYYKYFNKKNILFKLNITTVENACNIEKIVLNVSESIKVEEPN